MLFLNILASERFLPFYYYYYYIINISIIIITIIIIIVFDNSVHNFVT